MSVSTIEGVSQAPTFPAPGLYPDLDPAVYHAPQKAKTYADMTVSKSLLWAFRDNPDLWTRTKPKEASKPMIYGSLVDVLALTPDRFADLYRVTPKTYQAMPKTKGGQVTEKAWNGNATACKEWRDELPEGVEPIHHAMMDDALEAISILKGDDDWSALIEGAQTQTACVGMAIDKETNVTVRAKCQIDVVPNASGPFGNALVDMKQTAKLKSEKELRWHIHDQGWHVQGAFYRDLYHAVTGEWRPRFCLALQMSEEPFDVYVKELDQASLAEGRKLYLEALHEWCKFLMTGYAPNPIRELESVGIPEHLLT